MLYEYEHIQKCVHEIDALEKHLNEVLHSDITVTFWDIKTGNNTQLIKEHIPYDLDHFKAQYINGIQKSIETKKGYIRAILK